MTTLNREVTTDDSTGEVTMGDVADSVERLSRSIDRLLTVIDRLLTVLSAPPAVSESRDRRHSNPRAHGPGGGDFQDIPGAVRERAETGTATATGRVVNDMTATLR